MKKYTMNVLIFGLIVCCLIAIYKLQINQVDTLIHPPKYSNEKKSIENALMETCGKNYTLKAAVEGENISTVLYQDIDDDSVNEAIVFFVESNNSASMNMCIFKLDGDEWVAKAQMSAAYNEIRRIDFSDINKDGSSEIIVCYGSYDSTIIRDIHIYSFDASKNEIADIFKSTYSFCKIFDIDRDGADDIFLLDSVSYNKASFISYKDSKVKSYYSVEVDKAISSVISVNCDYPTAFSSARFFIDGQSSDGKLLTSVISWDNKKKAFVTEKINGNSLASLSKRSVAITCEDVDNDGNIEIPFEASSSSRGKLDESYQTMIEWCKLSSDKKKTVGYMIENKQYGYYLKIPDEIPNDYAFTVTKSNESMIFLRYNSNTNSTQLLLEIRAMDNTSIYEIDSNYTYIAANREFDYYCRMNENANDSIVKKSDVADNLIFELKGCF